MQCFALAVLAKDAKILGYVQDPEHTGTPGKMVSKSGVDLSSRMTALEQK